MFKIRPSDIFGDRAEKFFHSLAVFVKDNHDRIKADIEKEMATLVLSAELYENWKLLNRTEKTILNRMLDGLAKKLQWNWIRLIEFGGINSYLSLNFSV